MTINVTNCYNGLTGRMHNGKKENRSKDLKRHFMKYIYLNFNHAKL